jgi:aminoglycoside phosphotransferase (APT) family kinase protein
MSANLADEATEVRPGDELDRAALETWLLGHVRGARGPLRIGQFAQGHSNLNYLLQLGDSELVLRRPPPGAGHANDLGREYRFLASLHPAWDKAPEPLAYCPDPAVIGAPFHITRRVHGIVLRRSLPPRGFEPDRLAALGDSFAATLAQLHRVDASLAALGDFGRPQGWASRQIEGWQRRYQRARTADSPDLGAIVRWLRLRLPSETGPALIHGDFRHDNLILDPDDPCRVRAVLDWELATLADPQLDLGMALAYWIEAGDPADLQQFGISHHPGNPDRAALVAAYERHAARRITDPVFVFVFGLLRLASVMQPIYARHWRSGLSDARHARILGLVHDVVDLAERAIRRDRISDLQRAA